MMVNYLFYLTKHNFSGFGLAVFDTVGECLHPMMLKSEINAEKLKNIIQPLKTRGGTTL